MIIAMTVASSPPGYGSEAPARVTIDLSGGPGGSVPVLGGLTDLTLAEDADLTLAIRKLGYSIVYEDAAVALTEAPDTVRGFIRQRYRWMYGTMQAAWKHRDVLFRPRYGALGFVALPNVIVFQVLFPLVSPIMDLLLTCGAD
jgi:cellulose synthase/poly-beta-1,6-N-acetylglucosamine synthase-like glycosyltransferase